MREIDILKDRLEGLSTKEIIEYLLKEYRGKVALSSSMGAEDQLLTDMIYKVDTKSRVFTLDTGRLPYETYDLIERTSKFYGSNIELFFPENKLVEEYVKRDGINGFYNSIRSRKECCQIRKIEPLKRALKGVEVWITGLRASQSITRESLSLVEFDNSFDLIKVNPLKDWSEDDVWRYIRENSVPYNKLHDQNYPSIGCAPCTRAISEGEDIRDGRWWWEDREHKECGLHLKGDKDGR